MSEAVLAGVLAEQVDRSQSDHEELWGTPRGERWAIPKPPSSASA